MIVRAVQSPYTPRTPPLQCEINVSEDSYCGPAPVTRPGHPRLKALMLVGSLVASGRGALMPMAPSHPAIVVPVGEYLNPVLSRDAPDPGVIRVGHEYYVATTGQDSAGDFPLYRSPDLVHWSPDGAIFPPGHEPSWARSDFWAPEIHQVGNHFVAYFAARDDSGRLCIGAATASSPEGPFADLGHPLIRNMQVGVIDPTFLRTEDGQQYLYWKEDGNGNHPPQPSRIMAAALSTDGLTLTGQPTPVLQNDPKSWEGGVVEAPEIMQHGDWYYLFYSGNGYSGSRYAVGVARSRSPLGPFEKQGAPILHSSPEWQGPGHISLVQTPGGQDWMLYHAWPSDHRGRELMLDRIQWGADGWPFIGNGEPSDTPRPVPS
ncbi:MAG: glycoside hydrolase family 43 protein [Candidatus Xenobia bacterium]